MHKISLQYRTEELHFVEKSEKDYKNFLCPDNKTSYTTFDEIQKNFRLILRKVSKYNMTIKSGYSFLTEERGGERGRERQRRTSRRGTEILSRDSHTTRETPRDSNMS